MECRSKMKFTKSTRLPDDTSDILNLLGQPVSYTAKLYLAEYEGITRDCVHALKYANNQCLGELFSGWMADRVQQAGWQVDIVMPVPLSRQRVRQRGYNQSALIARPLALRLKVPYQPYGLMRIRNTPSQVGLSAEERRENVAGAFKAVQGMVAGKKVLLVDDVTTTGATIEACSNALLAGGAISVYCVTFAGFSQRIFSSNSTLHTV